MACVYSLKGNPAVWYFGGSGGNSSVVECDLAKVEVAGSNPVSRSNLRSRLQRARELRLAGQAKVVHRSSGGAKVDPQRCQPSALQNSMVNSRRATEGALFRGAVAKR